MTENLVRAHSFFEAWRIARCQFPTSEPRRRAPLDLFEAVVGSDSILAAAAFLSVFRAAVFCPRRCQGERAWLKMPGKVEHPMLAIAQNAVRAADVRKPEWVSSAAALAAGAIEVRDEVAPESCVLSCGDDYQVTPAETWLLEWLQHGPPAKKEAALLALFVAGPMVSWTASQRFHSWNECQVSDVEGPLTVLAGMVARAIGRRCHRPRLYRAEVPA